MSKLTNQKPIGNDRCTQCSKHVVYSNRKTPENDKKIIFTNNANLPTICPYCGEILFWKILPNKYQGYVFSLTRS